MLNHFRPCDLGWFCILHCFPSEVEPTSYKRLIEVNSDSVILPRTTLIVLFKFKLYRFTTRHSCSAAYIILFILTFYHHCICIRFQNCLLRGQECQHIFPQDFAAWKYTMHFFMELLLHFCLLCTFDCYVICVSCVSFIEDVAI